MIYYFPPHDKTFLTSLSVGKISKLLSKPSGDETRQSSNELMVYRRGKSWLLYPLVNALKIYVTLWMPLSANTPITNTKVPSKILLVYLSTKIHSERKKSLFSFMYPPSQQIVRDEHLLLHKWIFKINENKEKNTRRLLKFVCTKKWNIKFEK